MAEVAFEGVDKIYDNGVQAVFDLSMEAHDGEFLVLVGPSGCGKTTAPRMWPRPRADLHRRTGPQRPDAEGARHRDGLPELRALPASLGRREHRLRAAPAQGA